MQILVIADYLPYPLIGGDRIRIYNLLRRVAQTHDVSLVTFLEKPEDVEGIPHLKEFCTEVKAVDFQARSRWAKLPGMVGYALTGKPPELSLLYSHELAKRIQFLASKINFDIVQVEHARMGLYLQALPPHTQAKTLLMFHNFTSQQYGRVSQVELRWDRKFRSWSNSIAMGMWEPRYAACFDRCTTVSEEDKLLLLTANPSLQIDVIPNGVDVEKYQLLPEPYSQSNLLFIGNMGYPPCVDAAMYFCREILPYIHRINPNIHVWIVGRDPRAEVSALENEHIHVTGRVDDVRPYYERCAISIVPLRAGGGTRLKILEAMALGRPVVSTTVGCEGLHVKHGSHLLIADTPETFAEQTIRLLADHPLYQAITRNARRLVEDEYGWDGIAQRLIRAYEIMRSTSEPVV